MTHIGRPHECDTDEFSPLVQSETRGSSIIVRLSYVSIGLLLVVVGVVGWILPFVPGVPVLLVGLGMIAIVVPGGARLINRIDETLPDWLRRSLRLRKHVVSSKTQVDKFFTSQDS